jgi:hypothetical protein
MVGCLSNGERSLGLRLRATGVAICERGAGDVVHNFGRERLRDFGRERPQWSSCFSLNIWSWPVRGGDSGLFGSRCLIDSTFRIMLAPVLL